ncbi:MAG: hypothetical protein GC179_16075 [Anaerolineaceae bacterium]|nr:hypothetical protein [Anaerolineaceae bacterium]
MLSYNKYFTKLLSRLFLFVIALLGLVYLPQITLAQQTENDTAKASEILAQVNAWRIANGLWPLTSNTTLDALALAQANYVLPFALNIDDESLFHLDAKQRNPRQRGAAAGWPIYGTNADHIEIGENAGVGGSKFVMNFWKGSPIHAKAALSTTYREVGVAALPMKGGLYLYMMDFGARPGVLPVVIAADGKHLWLTEEKSRYANVSATTQVRLLDASGNPLTDLMKWSPSILIPDNSTPNFQVVYTNGADQVTTLVNRDPSAVVNIQATPTTIGALPTATPTVSATNATSAASTVVPNVTPTVPAPVATAIPTVNPATADILITYDANSLFLRNNSSSPININGLSLIGSGVTVGTPLWSRFSEFPVDAFPSSHCLAIELTGTDLPIPSTCKWTRGIITLTAAKIFWTKDDFIVSVNGTTLATCKVNAGQCAIDLP